VRRREKVAEMTVQGAPPKAIAQALSAPLRTVERDLNSLRGSFNLDTPEVWKQHREAVRQEFLDMVEATDTIKDVERRIASRLQVFDRIVRLEGLDAPSKSQSTNLTLTDNTGVTFDFLKHSHGLSESQLSEVFAFMDSLPRAKPVIDASYFPDASYQDEPKQLQEGSPDGDTRTD
jgi:hypothetical protein